MEDLKRGARKWLYLSLVFIFVLFFTEVRSEPGSLDIENLGNNLAKCISVASILLGSSICVGMDIAIGVQAIKEKIKKRKEKTNDTN